MFLCLAQQVRGKKLLQTSAVNESLQSLLRSNSHARLLSRRTESCDDFDSANYSDSLSISISPYFSVSQNILKML